MIPGSRAAIVFRSTPKIEVLMMVLER